MRWMRLIVTFSVGLAVVVVVGSVGAVAAAMAFGVEPGDGLILIGCGDAIFKAG
jgi:hypothetical protein